MGTATAPLALAAVGVGCGIALARWRSGSLTQAACSLDVRATIDVLGSEPVMSVAEQSHVVGLGVAALAGWLVMVELEPGSAAAADAVGIDPTAAEPIAFEHFAACGARNVGAPWLGCAGRSVRRR